MAVPVTTITSVLPGILSFSLTWTRADPGTKGYYELQYSTNNGVSWQLAGLYGMSVTTAFFTAVGNPAQLLNPSLFYTFRIRAAHPTRGIGPYSSKTLQVKTLSATPAAPINIVAANNIGSINIKWSAPTHVGSTNISAYRIEYSSNGGTSWTTTPDITSTTFSYILTGLVNGTTYLCRVSAKNGSGWGESSAPQTVLVFAPPSAPTNLRAIRLGNNQSVDLSWIPPTNNGGKAIVEYGIRCAGFKTLAEAQAYIPTPQNSVPFDLTTRRVANTNNTNLYRVTNLKDGLFYAFTIRAYNVMGSTTYNVPGGSSVWSNKALARPISPPDVPSQPAITGLGEGSVTIAWTPPTNTGGLNVLLLDYIIQYYDGTSWIQYNDGYNTNTTATISNLTPGQSYSFRVAAVNIVGAGQFSKLSVSVTPGSTPPAPPTNIQGTPLNQSVNLSWSTPTNTGGLPIVDYRIQISSNNGTTWTNYGVPVSGTSTLISGLVNGSSYKFRVAATNIIGVGPYSLPSSTIIPQPTAPEQPVSVSAQALNAAAIVYWTPPANDNGSPITSYKIEIASTGFPLGDWTELTTVAATTNSIHVSGLINGNNYRFKVYAINAIGTSPGTLSGMIMPEGPPPESLTYLFDVDSISSALNTALNNNQILSMSPWEEYIFSAVNRLSKFIKYKDDVISGIRGISGYEQFQGAIADSINFEYAESALYVAKAAPNSYVSLSNSNPIKINTISYSVYINLFYLNRYNISNWIDIISHELLHALGVGVFWNIYPPSPTICPQNTYNTSCGFLNGTAYEQTQMAYNSITGLSSYLYQPINIPLEITGGSGTVNSHWENQSRYFSPSTEKPNYPGVLNELMVGSAPNPGETRVLSQLTLKNLVDFGYEEINPGESEGIPTLDTNFNIVSIQQTNTQQTDIANNTPNIHLGCGFDENQSKSQLVGKINIL
jgi:hypothetical protein